MSTRCRAARGVMFWIVLAIAGGNAGSRAQEAPAAHASDARTSMSGTWLNTLEPAPADSEPPCVRTRLVPIRPGVNRAVLEPAGDTNDTRAQFVAAPILMDPFDEALVSWNVRVPAGTGFSVEVRVAHDERWSPWLYVGDGGLVPTAVRVTEFDGGRIDTDYFRGDHVFERLQYRILGYARADALGPARADSLGPARADAQTKELAIARVVVCFSDHREGAFHTSTAREPSVARALDVPWRSQKSEKPEIAGRICSPTSLAMVLAYRGVDQTTLAVAERAYDAVHDIYGNWPRNIQAAYSFGVPGYLRRFVLWSTVEEEIAHGQPLILSIAVKKGELTGAPYESTSGHLIVLTGFDEHGDCLVNDPAAKDAAHGRTTYARAEMERVWLAHGGTAYVLLPAGE